MKFDNIRQLAFISALIMSFVLFSAIPSFAQTRYSVTAAIANVRSGPGLNYAILWKVERNHPVNVIQTMDDWYQFTDFEGDKGWIAKKLLSRQSTVIVLKENCNIRSGPGTQYSVVFTSNRGVPYKVLERKDAWTHIQHADGEKGWIHQELVW